MDETFLEAMDRLRRTHEAVPWATATSARELEPAAAQWLDAVYRAYQLADERTLPDLQAFAQETAPEVRPRAVLLWPLVRSAEEVLERLDHHGDWARYCHRRSALEVVKTLYHGLTEEPGPFEVPGSGTEALDDLMESFAEDYGNLYEDEIPSFVPPSHWWWWAPDPPPAEPSSSP